jgi:hypothetical protein
MVEANGHLFLARHYALPLLEPEGHKLVGEAHYTEYTDLGQTEDGLSAQE